MTNNRKPDTATMAEMQAVSKSEFCDAMSQICAAVHIITTDGVAGRGGFTATAVCSLSDSPPSLLVCMRRESAQHDLFKRNGHFCVNALSYAQANLAGVFADKNTEMDKRYASADWQTLRTGSPALKNALLNVDCVLENLHETTTHSIFIGRIVAIEKWQSRHSLVYFDRAYRYVKKIDAAIA
ncbi:flavin reductase [Gibbsiella dentisursi]|uniref:Flavin reductase n=2 Tax=Gibbsiella TaxID=929812 RepID=A0ABP7LSA5_9GAMM